MVENNDVAHVRAIEGEEMVVLMGVQWSLIEMGGLVKKV